MMLSPFSRGWRALLAVSLCAGLAVACGDGGRRAANGPDGAPGRGREQNERRNDGSPRAERRDDAADRRRDESSRWDKLGERMVDGKNDRDAIAVGRADGRFEAIQLKVEGSALELDEVKVTFADGSVFEPKTKMTFGNGATTRVIDLPGGKRAIQRVEFKYGNLPGGGRAQVELWAR